ncbi:MAG: GIY-YIG nuclease family protein [Lacipirellulaceae bacterium]
MSKIIKLYCPKCGSAAQGQAEQFADAIACPSCEQKVVFVDYAHEAIAAPPKPKGKPTPTWADRLLQVLIGCGVALIGITLLGLLNGNVSNSTWGSIGAVVAAGAALFQIARLKRDKLHADEARKRTERALVLSNAQITTAANINQGFKKNFDQLVKDEAAKLNVQNAKIVERIDEAKKDAEGRIRKADEQDLRLKRLGNRFLEDRFEAILLDVTATNLEGSKQRLKEAIDFCRRNDCHILNRREEELNRELVQRYHEEVRRKRNRMQRHAVAKQIQEERRRQEELEAELSRIESEKSAIRDKLASASETSVGDDTVLEKLKKQLADLEAEASHTSDLWRDREKGHIYVASNIGTFGEGIFKINMTSRSDPHGVIEELSKQATPFPFELHMLVSSERAAELLGLIHEALHSTRVNRVDFTKDFFRVNRDDIWRVVVANHGVIEYEDLPSPAQYQESAAMSEGEFERVSKAVLD